MTSISSLPMTMTRIALRTGLFVLTLCATAVLFGFLFLDSIARIALAPSLSELGVELEEIAGLQLRTQTIQIERIDFRFSNSPQASQLDQLTIDYNWQELLAGRVTNIHAESLHLVLAEPNQSDAPDANTGLDTLPSLHSIVPLLAGTPFESMTIDSLTVNPYLEAALVRIQHRDNTLEIALAQPSTDVELKLHWPEAAATNLTGTLTLEHSHRPALELAFTLSEQDEQARLQTSVRSQTEQLQALLDEHQLLLLPFIKLHGEFVFELTLSTSNTPERDLAFSFVAPASQPLAIDIGENMPLEMGTMQWLNTAELSVNGDVGLSELGMSINASALTGQLMVTPSQAPATTMTISIPSLAVTCSDIEHCSAQLRTTLQLDSFAAGSLSAQTVLAFSDFSMNLSPEQTQITFAQGSRLEAAILSAADLSLLNPNLLVQDTLALTLASNGDWEVASDAIDLFVPDLIHAEKSTHFAIAAQQFRASNSATNTQGLQLASTLQFRNIGSDWLAFSLRKPEANLKLALREEHIDLQGNVRLADREVLQIDAIWELPQNNGTLQIMIPELSFAQSGQSFSQFFFRPPFNADLLDGSLQGQASLQVRQDDALNWLVDGPVSISANAISGFYEEIGLINFNTVLQGEFVASSQFISEANQAISIERIDVGLPVENIMLNYAINTEDSTVAIDALEATLFRGKVRSRRIDYDWNAEHNQAELIIERLDLARLLDLAAYDAVRATGLLSGTLPVALTGLKPSIGAGKLYVEAPGGAIHYAALGAGGGNAALDFVNEALSNYQYDLMETTVEYQPSGELDLGVRLQGLNPDMNNGQRINLNLNINDNIPALLQSLQSGRSIAEAVERALQ